MDESKIDQILAEVRAHRKDWKDEIQKTKAELEKLREEDEVRREKFIKKTNLFGGFGILKIIGLAAAIYATFIVIEQIHYSYFVSDDFEPIHFAGPSADLSKIAGNYTPVDESAGKLFQLVSVGGSRILIYGDMESSLDVAGDWFSQSEFKGGALYHEDVHDPGDAVYMNLVIRAEGEALFLGMSDLGMPVENFIELKNVK